MPKSSTNAHEDRSLPARRAMMEKASAILSREASLATFRQTYSRNNPGASISKNVFYFARSLYPARVVLWGPYLYVEAPGVRLPSEFEVVDEEYRKRLRIGALHFRLRLTNPGSLRAVEELVRKLKSASRGAGPRRPGSASTR